MFLPAAVTISSDLELQLVLRRVIEAAVDVGLVWLAVVAVLASLIGAFYYLRIVKLMYFDDPVDRAPLEARTDMRALLSLNGLALLLFGIISFTRDSSSYTMRRLR